MTESYQSKYEALFRALVWHDKAHAWWVDSFSLEMSAYKDAHEVYEDLKTLKGLKGSKP